ncbi:hypothetical protein MBLNU230_g8563t1 [Neophaeotheca triangularis]
MAAGAAARRLAQKHPLQRLDSPSRGTSAALHMSGLVSFAYSFAFLVLNPNPINDSYGWHMQYLTIIGLSLAAATFTAGLLADLTLSHRLFQVKNALSVASAPLECLISLLYWTLRAIDTHLVLPPDIDPIPLPADASFHLAPSLFLILDLLFLSPPYTLAFLPALGLSGFIAFGYWFWIEECFRHNGFYPYPLFEILGTPGRVGLFAVSAALMAAATAGLGWVYERVNGWEVREEQRGVRKERSGNIKGE